MYGLVKLAKQKKKVFLGGTCRGKKWRDDLIPMLEIDYFNPIVKDWNEKAYQEELRQRKTSDFVLYVITKDTKGLYSVAEVVDDSNKQPSKTIFYVMKEGFDKQELKSLEAVEKMVKKNGGHVFNSLKEVADFVNKG